MGRMRATLSQAMNSFGLNSALGMLLKARREYDRLVSADIAEDRRNAAINLAMSFRHPNDWLWNGVRPHRTDPHLMRELDIQDRRIKERDILAWFERHCPDIVIRQAICIGSKHIRFNTARPGIGVLNPMGSLMLTGIHCTSFALL